MGTGIYQKLYAVMSELDYIQKDKENSFHRYRYASEAAIKDHVHAALVKHRLLFLPRKTELCDRVPGLGKDGKEALTVLKLYYQFVDIDSGETFDGELHGIGADAMDKGIYKAITGSLKYIFTTTFVIPTGDDPEEEPKPTKAEAREQQQQIAQRKIAEQQAGTSVPTWDWRIALPKFLGLTKKYGAEEVQAALVAQGYQDVQDIPSREIAAQVYTAVEAKLAEPKPEEPPAWVEAPHQAIKEASPLASMLERASNIDKRLAIFKNLRLDLVEARGEKEADLAYRTVLAKHGAQPASDGQVHANAIANNPGKSKAAITELYQLTKPQAVNA